MIAANCYYRDTRFKLFDCLTGTGMQWDTNEHYHMIMPIILTVHATSTRMKVKRDDQRYQSGRGAGNVDTY